MERICLIYCLRYYIDFWYFLCTYFRFSIISISLFHSYVVMFIFGDHFSGLRNAVNVDIKDDAMIWLILSITLLMWFCCSTEIIKQFIFWWKILNIIHVCFKRDYKEGLYMVLLCTFVFLLRDKQLPFSVFQ